MEYKLYEYQQKTVNNIAKAAIVFDKILLVSPTGSGKTIMALSMVERMLRKGYKVLFTTPRRKLVTQTAEKFGYGNILMGANSVKTASNLTIATIQTLHSRAHNFDNYDFIFVDECHYAGDSVMVANILESKAKIVGMSATPVDQHGYLLDGYEEIVVSITKRELVGMGRLLNVEMYCPDPTFDVADIDVQNGDYNMSKASNIVAKKKIMKNIVQHWMTKANKLKTLCFACDIRHAEALRDEFREHRIQADCVHSGMHETEVQKIYDWFENDDIKVLINVDMATFGFDCPSIECLLFARPVKSIRLYHQMVGRGTRVHKGIDKCIILDCAGVYKDCGDPLDEIKLIPKPIMKSVKLDNIVREITGKKPEDLPEEKLCSLRRVSNLLDLYIGKQYRFENKELLPDVKNFLDKYGIYNWRQNSGAAFISNRWVHFASKSGLPDITIMYKGFYVGLELKIKNKSFTEKQKVTIPELEANGCCVKVVTDIVELYNIIQDIEKYVTETDGVISVDKKLFIDDEIQKRNKKGLG